MPANTYTLIEKIVVGAAGASSVTFTSIPQTYTDLKVVVSCRGSRSNAVDFLQIKFNNSSTSYSMNALAISGSSGASFTDTSIYVPVSGNNSTASTFGNAEFYVPNYTSSNNKSVSVDAVSENNATTNQMYLLAGLWSNTAAITQIDLAPLSGYGPTLLQYTSAYLYGIAKEGVSPSPSSAPYATGGDSIVFDGTYWIHTFRSSGTFTPLKSLTCDYLVVAGGGGGAASGAGAGGMRCTVGATGGGGSLESALSLTAQAYTVTVGAGGAGAANGQANNGSNGSNSVFASITSTGGGGGINGGAPQLNNGQSGGSGSGGYAGGDSSGGVATGGAGTANQGYAGGSSFTKTVNSSSTGGGGGAGAVGGSATAINTAGAGGNGATTSISGTSTTYAGGGGGGIYVNATAVSGGTGGGGTGATNNAAGSSGTANTGGGGGGFYSEPYKTAAYSGGSGIVIVRYAA